MTAADKIAADLRDAFRRIAVLDVPATVRAYLRRAHEANDFDTAMSHALSTIVALDDAEAAAKAEVEAAQARQKTVTEASAKAREALRLAMVACGGPGVATVKSGHHKAYLKEGSTKVEITDKDALALDYWRYPPAEPDKALVKALLAQGKTIAGAALVQSPPALVITAKDR
jgi:hypothetical protein